MTMQQETFPTLTSSRPPMDEVIWELNWNSRDGQNETFCDNDELSKDSILGFTDDGSDPYRNTVIQSVNWELR